MPKMPKTPKIEIVPLSALAPNPDNPSLPTPRGDSLLETSLSEIGFAAAGVLDRDRTLLDGHKRLRTLPNTPNIDQEHAIIVHTDGNMSVFVQRDDLDIDSPDPEIRRRTQRSTVLHNRTGELSTWDPSTLERLELDGLSLDDLWLPEERAALALNASSALEPDFSDFSGFSDASTAPISYRVVIDNLSLNDAKMLAESHPSARVEQYRRKE